MNKETDIVVHMKPKKVVKYRIVKYGKNPTYYKHGCSECKYIGSFFYDGKGYDVYDASHQYVTDEEPFAYGLLLRFGEDMNYWSGMESLFHSLIEDSPVAGQIAVIMFVSYLRKKLLGK